MKKLVVGLGNPGPEYENTYHNSGFVVVDLMSNTKKYNKKFDGLVTETENYIFLKPQTFMNKSGQSVQKALNYYKLPLENLIVIHDDADIEAGKYKIQKGRSSAGHNGVEDIIEKLGTEDFWRVRIGIPRPENQNITLKDWVLTKIKPDVFDLEKISPNLIKDIEKL